eukprot:scaffold58305_cov60-Phaeocystis_antarctica.AAC.2
MPPQARDTRGERSGHWAPSCCLWPSTAFGRVGQASSSNSSRLTLARALTQARQQDRHHGRAQHGRRALDRLRAAALAHMHALQRQRA